MAKFRPFLSFFYGALTIFLSIIILDFFKLGVGFNLIYGTLFGGLASLISAWLRSLGKN